MAKVLVTGGTGLIGKALTSTLISRGYEVIVLTRTKPKDAESRPGLRFAEWDIEKMKIDQEAIREADFIIHLAGAGVADKRWSEKRKAEIVESRVKSGELLVKSLKEIPNKIQRVVSASAIGWYGPDRQGGVPFKESDPPAEDFLGTTCVKWEQSLQPVEALGKDLVFLRTGIVLSTRGGALKEFEKPIRFGVAAILGKGSQVISWIHIDDLVGIYLDAIEKKNFAGVYNAVAPHPVTNKTLTLELASQIKGNFFIPVHVPEFALKLALGEMSIEVLKSTTVSSSRLIESGFSFRFPTIENAIRDLYKK